MTLCELEIAHLSPPMECRSVRRNPAATPAGRRHCVEWDLLLLLSSLTVLTNSNFRALARSAQSWSSYSGYFRESSGSRSTRSCDCATDCAFSSHVLCLPTPKRYWYFWQRLHERHRNKCTFTDIAKNTYQNITAEKLRLVQFLLRREQNFEKNDEQLSASIVVRSSSGLSQHR